MYMKQHIIFQEIL